jgi:hypothetical protein
VGRVVRIHAFYWNVPGSNHVSVIGYISEALIILLSSKSLLYNYSISYEHFLLVI